LERHLPACRAKELTLCLLEVGMCTTILVPLDGSELAETALSLLRDPLIRPGGPSVTLLRVVDADVPQPDEALEEAQTYLEGVRSSLEVAGITCATRIERGDPASGIVGAIETFNPSLVVMSTHGRSGMSRMLRGSVAERVLRSSTAPLLLANPEAIHRAAGSCERILVPLDGSEFADAVLPIVTQFAKALGAEVTLFRVQPFAPAAIPSPILAPSVWDPRKVEETLRSQAEQLKAADVNVRVRAAIGNEATEIVARAAKSDLVAMTSHGRSGVGRWWFGSVAEQVVRHAECPLLVVRPA
jgi:nucleotide-binding universal stress UspA family protein